MDSSSLQHGPTCTKKSKQKSGGEKISSEPWVKKLIMLKTDHSSGKRCLCILYNLAGDVAISSKILKTSTHTP